MIDGSGVAGLKNISRAILTAVITFILAIAIFATTAFGQLVSAYNVEIMINNESIVITTNEDEPIKILSQANISLVESDKLDISEFKAGDGGIIKIDRLNTVNVEFGDAITTYSVYSDTVEEALEEIGITINDGDELNYQKTDSVEDGMIIEIKSAFYVTLSADGEKAKYAICDGTVADLLNLAQVTLGEDDYTEPGVEEQLEADMTVKVYRVEYKEETVNETVEFDTQTEKDSSMYDNQSEVVTDGVDGEDEVTYKVKYVNGKEESKEEISRTTVKESVTKVVKVGTKESKGTTDTKANGVKSKNGYTLGQTLSGKYTHYCACGICGSGTGVTASGKKVYTGMSNPYYVACNWLPLGSVINVDGTNYLVVDRGGSSLSTPGRIDIFTPGGHQAALRAGTGYCTITIVRLGW